MVVVELQWLTISFNHGVPAHPLSYAVDALVLEPSIYGLLCELLNQFVHMGVFTMETLPLGVVIISYNLSVWGVNSTCEQVSLIDLLHHHVHLLLHHLQG